MIQDFVQAIVDVSRDTVNGIHTAIPGTIVSMSDGIATVKPIGQYKVPNGEKMEFPIISGVPVVFPCSTTQDIGVYFPLFPGDNCLIIFSEIEIDEFMSGSEAEGTLKFDLTSAICIPGLTKNHPTTDGILLKCKDKQIEITSGGVNIIGNVTVKGTVTAYNIGD